MIYNYTQIQKKDQNRVFLIGVALAFVFAIIASFTLVTSAAKMPKVDVCHVDGNGDYHLISVSGNAMPAHVAHGDAMPGEFPYKADCSMWTVVGSFYVSAKSVTGYNFSTTAGTNYYFVVSGEWFNAGGTVDQVDAQYASTNNWADHVNGPAIDERNLELQVNNEFGVWGEYSPSHIYSLAMVGDGSPMNFRIFDGNPNTPTSPNPGWYGDNTGGLTVTVYE